MSKRVHNNESISFVAFLLSTSNQQCRDLNNFVETNMAFEIERLNQQVLATSSTCPSLAQQTSNTWKRFLKCQDLWRWQLGATGQSGTAARRLLRHGPLHSWGLQHECEQHGGANNPRQQDDASLEPCCGTNKFAWLHQLALLPPLATSEVFQQLPQVLCGDHQNQQGEFHEQHARWNKKPVL